MTVYMLRSLDFIVPGEWQNVVGFGNTISAVTGITDKDGNHQMAREVWRLGSTNAV
jgi:hypothetical protein